MLYTRNGKIVSTGGGIRGLAQSLSLVTVLMRQIADHGLPVPQREFRFDPNRLWRIDLAYPVQKLALEVEGGLYVHGRHQRVGGFINDLEKYNRLTALSWRLLRFTRLDILGGNVTTKSIRHGCMQGAHWCCECKATNDPRHCEHRRKLVYKKQKRIEPSAVARIAEALEED